MITTEHDDAEAELRVAMCADRARAYLDGRGASWKPPARATMVERRMIAGRATAENRVAPARGESAAQLDADHLVVIAAEFRRARACADGKGACFAYSQPEKEARERRAVARIDRVVAAWRKEPEKPQKAGPPNDVAPPPADDSSPVAAAPKLTRFEEARALVSRMNPALSGGELDRKTQLAIKQSEDTTAARHARAAREEREKAAIPAPARNPDRRSAVAAKSAPWRELIAAQKAPARSAPVDVDALIAEQLRTAAGQDEIGRLSPPQIATVKSLMKDAHVAGEFPVQLRRIATAYARAHVTHLKEGGASGSNV